MSWDAYLEGNGETYIDTNYTHNTNGMIETALDKIGLSVDETDKPFWVQLGNTKMGRGAWWDLLDGLDGQQGKVLLSSLIQELESNPAIYLPMNPPNGWGDYDSLVRVLKKMWDAVPDEVATTWHVHG